MEYKFDQLKVENLNGTLNIGLNPFSTKEQQIEDFQVDTETLKVNPETDTNPFTKEFFKKCTVTSIIEFSILNKKRERHSMKCIDK